jgi:small-conductance mechanosensitive channel
MRAFRALLMGIGSAALWPLYLVLLAATARVAPCPRTAVRPFAFFLNALAVALFVVSLTRWLFRRQGWAERVLRCPPPVSRQLKRAGVGLVVAGMVLLLPQMLLDLNLIAPGGRPIVAAALVRLLGLGFEVVVWVVAFRLVRRRSALVQWLAQGPSALEGMGRHRWAIALAVLGYIGVVIGLDVQGYGFTARKLAAVGTQAVGLLAACGASYWTMLRAIDHHAWRWVRAGGRPHETEPDESLEHPHELPARLRRLARWIVPVVGLALGAWIWNVDLALFRSIGALPLLPLPSNLLTVGDLVSAAVIFFLTASAWRHMSTFFAVAVYPRMRDDQGLRFAVLTLSRYCVLGLGLLAGLSALHLGLDKIGVALAALGVGLGFGLQEIVSNFICGIILLLERPIRVGDIVTVAGMSGRIDRINIRATTIINADNQSIIVPNREFITENLVNWTHKDRIIRVTLRLTVEAGTDPDRVADLLLAIARADPDVILNPVPSATFDDFDAAGLRFVFHVHVPEPSLAPRVRHRLGARIQQRFHEEGIALQLPSQNVHLRSVPEGVGAWAPTAPEWLRADLAATLPPSPRLLTAPPAVEPAVPPNQCVDE